MVLDLRVKDLMHLHHYIGTLMRISFHSILTWCWNTFSLASMYLAVLISHKEGLGMIEAEYIELELAI